MNKKKISEIIKDKKPVNVSKFIDFCLYGKYGYYKNSNVLGKKGDFVTSPEISQLFGEIIGIYFINDLLEKKNKMFNLIELGPGNGTLINDMLNIANNFNKIRTSIRIKLIEINKSLISKQKKILKNNINNYKISWSKNFYIKNKSPCIIIANEFFDCLPIRQFYKKQNIWFEKMVTVNESGNYLKLIDKEIKEKKLLNKINQYESKEVLEYSISRENYFQKLCKHINIYGGKIIIIDYGYYERPNYFTLQSLKNNKKTNIFDNIGTQDITSLVDFKKLIEIAKFNNLTIENFCTQREFLLTYGIKLREKIISKKSTSDKKKMIKKGVERIIGENDMGTLFKVLILRKKNVS